MKGKAWIVGLAAFLLLPGCNPDSGSALLEVVYPSGYARTYAFDYEAEPDIAEYNDSMLKARFILGDDSIITPAIKLSQTAK